MVKKLPEMQEIQVGSQGCRDPLKKGMATHFSIIAREFHGQKTLVGYSPRGHEELNTMFTLQSR